MSPVLIYSRFFIFSLYYCMFISRCVLVFSFFSFHFRFSFSVFLLLYLVARVVKLLGVHPGSRVHPGYQELCTPTRTQVTQRKSQTCRKFQAKILKHLVHVLKSDSPLGTNGCWLSEVGQKCIVNGGKFG